jgi:hypothetical protein
MNKGTTTGAALLLAAGLWFVHKLQLFMAKIAPVGYQDNEGFHYGDPS